MSVINQEKKKTIVSKATDFKKNFKMYTNDLVKASRIKRNLKLIGSSGSSNQKDVEKAMTVEKISNGESAPNQQQLNSVYSSDSET